jgi:hypothetical protein
MRLAPSIYVLPAAGAARVHTIIEPTAAQRDAAAALARERPCAPASDCGTR